MPNQSNTNTFLEINVIVLKLISLYPFKEDGGILQKTLYLLFRIVNLTALYVIFIACGLDILQGEKETVTDYALNVIMIFCYTCVILTMQFFYYNANRIRELVMEINAVFKFKTDSGVIEKDLSKLNSFLKTITFGFTSLTCCAVVSMSSAPLLSNSQNRTLPIPGVYPFDYQQSPFYELTYFLQFYAQFVIGFVTAAADSFIICMILLTAAQFEILGSNFQNCLYKSLLEFGIPKETVLKFKEKFGSCHVPENDECVSDFHESSIKINYNHIYEVISSDKFAAHLKCVLSKYIKQHQNILKFSEKMEDSFYLLLLMKVASSMCYHIFMLFAMVTSSDSSLIMALGQYELSAVTELFILAAAGQELIDKSQLLRDMLYSSPWFLCDNNFKKLIYVILMRSNKYNRISVGKLYDLSLPAFLMIMKASMSYLAVLRQITE